MANRRYTFLDMLEAKKDMLEAKNSIAECNRQQDQKLRLLEIASNCSVPGEASSRTIERAIEFKKYIQDNE